MAKEFEIRAKNSPYYFEKAQCSECREFGVELMKHKFSDILTCVECVNDALRKLEDENEKHDDYRDQSYADLITERNL